MHYCLIAAAFTHSLKFTHALTGSLVYSLAAAAAAAAQAFNVCQLVHQVPRTTARAFFHIKDDDRIDVVDQRLTDGVAMLCDQTAHIYSEFFPH
jgi:hypothetical protein